jgi:hypothetical protein
MLPLKCVIPLFHGIRRCFVHLLNGSVEVCSVFIASPLRLFLCCLEQGVSIYKVFSSFSCLCMCGDNELIMNW